MYDYGALANVEKCSAEAPDHSDFVFPRFICGVSQTEGYIGIYMYLYLFNYFGECRDIYF